MSTSQRILRYTVLAVRSTGETAFFSFPHALGDTNSWAHSSAMGRFERLVKSRTCQAITVTRYFASGDRTAQIIKYWEHSKFRHGAPGAIKLCREQ